MLLLSSLLLIVLSNKCKRFIRRCSCRANENLGSINDGNCSDDDDDTIGSRIEDDEILLEISWEFNNNSADFVVVVIVGHESSSIDPIV
ncbi:hypothetical protein DERF_004106 [Dermatophagoides farinae]|uniref:Secreted protein n=1 Tax=Dermatophagoides farinae TaxID=6954 RepID=A0A922IFT4_DERFA|nr:hypothetical protein DERF_004106 [Dermatophagoides farinae]